MHYALDMQAYQKLRRGTEGCGVLNVPEPISRVDRADSFAGGGWRTKHKNTLSSAIAGFLIGLTDGSWTL